jgi:hypothetical protein
MGKIITLTEEVQCETRQISEIRTWCVKLGNNSWNYIKACVFVDVI